MTRAHPQEPRPPLALPVVAGATSRFGPQAHGVRPRPRRPRRRHPRLGGCYFILVLRHGRLESAALRKPSRRPARRFPNSINVVIVTDLVTFIGTPTCCSGRQPSRRGPAAKVEHGHSRRTLFGGALSASSSEACEKATPWLQRSRRRVGRWVRLLEPRPHGRLPFGGPLALLCSTVPPRRLWRPAGKSAMAGRRFFPMVFKVKAVAWTVVDLLRC